MRNTVVITGIGFVTPIKPFMGIDMFWNSLCSGEDAIKKMAPPTLDLGGEWLMACIDLSESHGFVSPEDKLQLISEEALIMAMHDAGLQTMHDGQSQFNIGLSIGTVLGNVLYKEKRLIENKKNELLYGIEKESLSYINSYLASKYAFKGPNLIISTACASGTDAIGIAARKIMSGKADIMIAGGIDVVSDFALVGFHALQAITYEKVRPFDKKRTGFALGEGAAFVILESEAHATRRGAKTYGKVMGYASRSDANHLTSPHREGRGLSEAISYALSENSLNPHEVNYINAHGTGTVYNDLMETKAIKKVFGHVAYEIPISSTKSMLGHSFGAAGAIEAICCLLSIKNKIIPPTINSSEVDPECDLDYVPNTSRFHDVKIAMSLSAGFGGQNSALVFGEK